MRTLKFGSLPRHIGEAIYVVALETDLNLFGHALKVIIELTPGHLAGTDPGEVLIMACVGCGSEVRIAARMYPITDSDRPRMAGAVQVVPAFCYFACGNLWHFDSDFHGESSMSLTQLNEGSGITQIRRGYCKCSATRGSVKQVVGGIK